ncbi:MAG: efflux RND transporter periplasmic adaptor subunit [Bacteroidetes bacterium]|nr:efflux RND transporter periplasmic adaptor subunit [Bacteroidota bacterium]
MKKYIVILTILSLSLFPSCGEALEGMEKLKEERKTIVTELSTLQTRLDELDEQIAELDTTTIVEVKKVSAITINEEVFEHYFEIQGSVKADKNVIVVPEVGGLISEISVHEGDQILKGSIIARINSDVVSSNMKELEEQRDLAKYMYDKQQSLYDKGVGTELALRQAEGQFKTLEQTIKSLQTQQGKFVVKAPFDGYVEQVFPVQGEMAGPASPIIRLIALDKMSVKADISESYLRGINMTSAAQLRFPSLGLEPMIGLKLKRIGKFVNPVNRTIAVEIDIPAKVEGAVPNLMSVLRIRDYVDSSALAVPTSVIRKDVEVPSVYIIKNGKAIRTEVVLGRSSGDYTVIESGISNGDQLVDKGLRGLKKDIEEIKVD